MSPWRKWHGLRTNARLAMRGRFRPYQATQTELRHGDREWKMLLLQEWSQKLGEEQCSSVSESLFLVKRAWGRVWQLYKVGEKEDADQLGTTWVGVLGRYSTLEQVRADSLICKSNLCTFLGVGDIRKVIDGETTGFGRSIVGPTAQPDFVWESYRSHM